MQQSTSTLHIPKFPKVARLFYAELRVYLRDFSLNLLGLGHELCPHLRILGSFCVLIELGLRGILFLEAPQKVIDDSFCVIFIHALLHVLSALVHVIARRDEDLLYIPRSLPRNLERRHLRHASIGHETVAQALASYRCLNSAALLDPVVDRLRGASVSYLALGGGVWCTQVSQVAHTGTLFVLALDRQGVFKLEYFEGEAGGRGYGICED
mmetsp:Transcript_85624/g.125335  ORF Transcript_85624/g.125335 Transcript_85624/m.125335 type:complete len:211 (-) Transcript_85624:1382-2014(-)